MAEAFLLFKSAFRYNGEMNLEKDVSILQQQTIMSVGKRIPLNIKKLGINGEGIGGNRPHATSSVQKRHHGAAILGQRLGKSGGKHQPEQANRRL